MNHQMLMASLILIPVIFGIVLYKLPLKFGKFVLLGVQVCLLALAVFLFLRTENDSELYTILGGDSPILNIALRGDRLSMLLVVVTNFLFGIGFIYKIKDKFFDGKIILLYLVLQGLTNGIFLTDDLFNLFILFEVSTVVITLLLMFKKEGRVVYDSLYYLITQMVSMMFFLFGIGFLYRTFGILSISAMSSLIPYVPANELVLPFSFMMAGLCFKLGIFPMYTWISRAYSLNSAPITQIAVMSSIVMKTGLYWLLRFNDMFSPAFDYSTFFIVFGVLTSLFGAMEAVLQKDIRLILAYSTVSQIGFMIVAAFLGDNVSHLGSTYHIFNHAIFKMILFLSAGLIIRNYETADIYEIRGKLKGIPVAAVASIIGMLAITGFPLTSGSISKYFMSAGLGSVWKEILFWIMSFGTILTFVRYATMFLPGKKEMFEIKAIKNLALSLLTIVSIVAGFSASYGINYLLQVDLKIDFIAFSIKGLIYLGLVVVAVIGYKRFLYKKKLWDNRLEHSLSFSRMCLVFVAFFTMLMVYGLWVVN